MDCDWMGLKHDHEIHGQFENIIPQDSKYQMSQLSHGNFWNVCHKMCNHICTFCGKHFKTFYVTIVILCLPNPLI